MEKHEKVSFQSEGVKVVGNLFDLRMPKNRHHILQSCVAGAMTGVKEQVAGRYAERLSESGFVTLALDIAFW